MKFLNTAWLIVCALMGGSMLAQEIDLQNHPGRAIYQKLCVECHGERGEGVEDKADDPLEGSRDIASLAGKIERTMPEDEENLCVGRDAKAVAEYVYHAFYSVEARARNTPARIELSRLTVPQYRKSVADLIGDFRPGYSIMIPEDRGLTAQYYGTQKFGERKELKDQKKRDRFERIDSQIQFDFKDTAPKFEEEMNFARNEFSIRWSGGLYAPKTGHYEFTIRTRNGVTLWVNENDTQDDSTTKTIDGYVAPNNEIREETGTIFLQKGQWVPFRLEFFRYKSKEALVELSWKPPHGVREPIPSQYFTPRTLKETCLVSTPFPADDRSVGYERGTAVSREWFDAITAAAIEASDYVMEHLDDLAGIRREDDDRIRGEKIGNFAIFFAERAFRRPLTEPERVELVDGRFADVETREQAIKRLVLLVLKDPRFLYPGVSKRSDGRSDSWDRADRLALAMWDSLPDGILRKRASDDRLKDVREVEEAVRRMARHPRTKAKMRGFFEHWLELDRADDLSKDRSVYPAYSEEVLSDLRTSLDLFLDDVVFSEKSDYRELLTADYLYLNPRLAKIYGPPDAKIESGFQKVKLDPNRRSGIVTHPFLLTTLAYHNNTSPIHRGVFLTRNIVGMSLNSPEMANEFVEGNFDPTLTMREKVEDLTRAKACMACHTTINPLGFSLENYDGIGRWRTKEKNTPIDAKSEFKTDSGEMIQLRGARDVAKFAAERRSAHEAFIEQLFHHIVKQPMLAYGPDVPERLRKDFEKSGYNVRDLIMKIAVIAAMEEGM
ncbi:MAG: DUF1592 domain-containing protein [Verrucomicrobiales bacterium]|nr:DUF1592 domain-containing protein [Verrucomicrobiales bacterium]